MKLLREFNKFFYRENQETAETIEKNKS